MRLAPLVLLAALAASFAASAENTLTDRDREILAARQRVQEETRARAQARCLEQHGADCVTDQGLQEWTLLDQTRQQYYYERYGLQPPAGTGATSGPLSPGTSTTGATGAPMSGQQR